MPRNTPWVVLAGRTRAERRKSRAGIRLKSLSVTPKTRARYESAVGLILPFLEQQQKDQTFDAVISEWVELQWVRGESVSTIADCLSGLHFFMPELKGTLRGAWRLFRAWRRVETPSRAPPITAELVKAIIGRATERVAIPFATGSAGISRPTTYRRVIGNSISRFGIYSDLWSPHFEEL